MKKSNQSCLINEIIDFVADWVSTKELEEWSSSYQDFINSIEKEIRKIFDKYE